MSKQFSIIPGDLSLDTWLLSDHAEERLRQRKFTLTEIAFVLKHGHVEYRTGMRFFFFGTKQIPPQHRNNIWAQRLVGTVVLASSRDCTIVTMYRNKDALREIRKKTKARAVA